MTLRCGTVLPFSVLTAYLHFGICALYEHLCHIQQRFPEEVQTVVERVKQTKQPALLTSKKEPQAVLISLEDYDKLETLRRRESAKNLRAWVHDVQELLKDERLPADLSTRHDYYLWEEQPALT